MYLIVLWMVILSTPGRQSACEMNTEVMKISLNALSSRKMIESSDRTLNISVPEQYVDFLPREIKTGDSVLQINSNHLSLPDVIFSKIMPSDTGSVSVYFRTTGSQFRYSGIIILHCSEGKYVFNTMHCVSEIE